MPTTKISVDEYEQMVDTGILTEYDRVELIRGEILEVYRGPQSDGTYREVQTLGRGQSTGILGLPGFVVAVDDVL